MTTTFNYFLHMYRQERLDEDAAWRAYDIEYAKKPRHVGEALKAIGLAYAGELAVSHFMALYEIKSAEEGEGTEFAHRVLACWWLWSQIAKGRPMRVPLRARGGDHSRRGLSPAQTPSRPHDGP